MSDDLDKTFSFVNEPGREPLSLRPKGPSWPTRLKSGIVAFLISGIGLAGALGVLHYMGKFPIPGQEAPIAHAQEARAVAVGPDVNHGDRPIPPRNPNGVGEQGRSLPRDGQRTVPPQTQAEVLPQQGPKASLKDMRATESDTDDATKAAIGLDEARTLLRNQGIAQTPQGFALQSETGAKSKVLELRGLVNAFNTAYDQVAMIKTVLARIKFLDQTIINLNNEIDQRRVAMGRFPARRVRGGGMFHGNNNVDNDLYEAIKAEEAALVSNRATFVQERDLLRTEQPGRHLTEATDALKSAKEAALHSLSYARDSIAETRRGYDNLANPQDVARALIRLGQPNLQPSADFLAAEQEFKDTERTAARLKMIPATTEPAGRPRR
jgi:hypothetical protein